MPFSLPNPFEIIAKHSSEPEEESEEIVLAIAVQNVLAPLGITQQQIAQYYFEVHHHMERTGNYNLMTIASNLQRNHNMDPALTHLISEVDHVLLTRYDLTSETKSKLLEIIDNLTFSQIYAILILLFPDQYQLGELPRDMVDNIHFLRKTIVEMDDGHAESFFHVLFNLVPYQSFNVVPPEFPTTNQLLNEAGVIFQMLNAMYEPLLMSVTFEEVNFFLEEVTRLRQTSEGYLPERVNSLLNQQLVHDLDMIDRWMLRRYGLRQIDSNPLTNI